MKLVAPGLVLALALVASPVAAQRTQDQDLHAVRELVLHATYREALTQVTSFLGRSDLDAQHRAAGLEVRAIVQLALRDEAGARETLADLYARDPGHRLEDPDASPVVQSAFAHARDAATPVAVELTDQTEAAPTEHAAPEVRVHVGAHADAVQELRVSYRREGDARWASVVLTADEAGNAESPLAISGAGSAAYGVEYHVDAVTPSGTVLAHLGTADAPLHIAVPEARAVVVETHVGEQDPVGPVAPAGGGGVETEAWFWVLMGTLIVGAGVGIGVGVVVGTTPTAQNGSLDTITLPLVAF